MQNDFFSRWYATRMLLTEGRSLYDLQNGREVVAFYKISMDPSEGNFYDPAYLILFILPLIRLPYHQALLFGWFSSSSSLSFRSGSYSGRGKVDQPIFNIPYFFAEVVFKQLIVLALIGLAIPLYWSRPSATLPTN